MVAVAQRSCSAQLLGHHLDGGPGAAILRRPTPLLKAAHDHDPAALDQGPGGVLAGAAVVRSWAGPKAWELAWLIVEYFCYCRGRPGTEALAEELDALCLVGVPGNPAIEGQRPVRVGAPHAGGQAVRVALATAPADR